MNRSAVILGVATMVAAATLAVPTSPASAATTWGSVGGLVANDHSGRVFVADQADSQLVVSDYTGKVIGTVPGITGATDVAQSDDGSVVYATAYSGHEIVAVNPDTLAVTQRYTVPTTTGPTHLAYTAGRVWFSYGDQWDGDLGSVDPTTGTVAMGQFTSGGAQAAYADWYSQALMDASPASPGILALSETGISSTALSVLDVSSGTPVSVAYHDRNYQLDAGADVDVIPGGSQILLNGTTRASYSNGTLTAAGAYPSATSADVGADGRVLQRSSSTVRLMAPNASTPTQSRTFGSEVDAVVWTPDQTRAVAITGASPNFVVNVYDPTLPPPTTPQLTLATSGRTLATGAYAPISVHLGPTASNRSVEIWADPAGTDLPAALVASGAVDTSGNLTASVRVTRNTLLTAKFAGDDADNPVNTSTTARVAVGLRIALGGQYKIARVGSTVAYWFHSASTPRLAIAMTYYPRRSAQVTVQVLQNGAWRTVDSKYFPLGTSGHTQITFSGGAPAGLRARMRAAYVSGGSGDSVNTTTISGWKYLYFTK